MTDRGRIDAELDGVRRSPDGSRLILLLRDSDGQKVSLSLPVSCLSAVMTAAPRPVDPGAAHAVDTWDITAAENGRDMILTFCTADGMVMSFTIKSWQAQGMATVATHSASREGSSRSVH